MNEVMTVLGPVPNDQLGLVLIHEHLFADTMREYRGDGLLHDVALAVDELECFAANGGGTVVELSAATLGRQPDLLREASERTGVNIVMGCGLYRDPYTLDADIDRRTTAAIADGLIHEIREGVGDTGIRPGIIGEAGADSAWVSAREERALRAAARAQLATGLTITLHAARWPVGEDLVALLREEGVPPERVIVGHLDTVPDPAAHRRLAEAGCWVEFDGFADVTSFSARRQAVWIRELVDAGFGDRILLAHDIFRQSHFRAFGGGGLSHLLTRGREQLLEAGVAETTLNLILHDNAQAALVGSAPA